MTQAQAAITVREAIKQAAAEVGCKPSEAHIPSQSNRQGLAARRMAIRLARDQGIPVHFLAAAFDRQRKTITELLR